MNTEVEVNPYELLDVKVESTEQEIRTAYRKRSLKVHPDRVRAITRRIRIERIEYLIYAPESQ